MDFPKRLAALRNERKMTQRSLAEHVGIHVSQIRRYEAGDSSPTLDVLRKLAVALSVSADTLVFDDNERGPDEDLRLQFEATTRLSDDEKTRRKGRHREHPPQPRGQTLGRIRASPAADRHSAMAGSKALWERLWGAPTPSLSRANGRSNDATPAPRQAALATPSLPAASTPRLAASHPASARPNPSGHPTVATTPNNVHHPDCHRLTHPSPQPKYRAQLRRDQQSQRQAPQYGHGCAPAPRAAWGLGCSSRWSRSAHPYGK